MKSVGIGRQASESLDIQVYCATRSRPVDIERCLSCEMVCLAAERVTHRTQVRDANFASLARLKVAIY